MVQTATPVSNATILKGPGTFQRCQPSSRFSSQLTIAPSAAAHLAMQRLQSSCGPCSRISEDHEVVLNIHARLRQMQSMTASKGNLRISRHGDCVSVL